MKINFGCGGKLLDGWVNVDIDRSQGADVVCDMEQFPYPFDDNCADEILCEMVLEHIHTPSMAINEFHRIIKPEGKVTIITPHFSSPYALSADSHISIFNIGYFWSHRVGETDLFNRNEGEHHWNNKVENRSKWSDVDVLLMFPRGYLTIPSFPFQFIFNIHKYAQAIYEILFSNFYRASEIHIVYKDKVI